MTPLELHILAASITLGALSSLSLYIYDSRKKYGRPARPSEWSKPEVRRWVRQYRGIVHETFERGEAAGAGVRYRSYRDYLEKAHKASILKQLYPIRIIPTHMPKSTTATSPKIVALVQGADIFHFQKGEVTLSFEFKGDLEKRKANELVFLELLEAAKAAVTTVLDKNI